MTDSLPVLDADPVASKRPMHERYARASSLAADMLPALMRNRKIDPHWTGNGDEFWYSRQTNDDVPGEEFVLVDPEAGTRKVHASLGELGIATESPSARPDVLLSPDGRHGVFRRAFNLWLLEVDSGLETPLTHSGEEAFAWGELPENSNMFVPFRRMGIVLPPVGTVFSPSGRKVMTVRADQRQMIRRHMVEHVPTDFGARPVCHEIRVTLEDEPPPPSAECVVIDLDAGTSTIVDVTDGLASALMSNGSSEVAWRGDESTFFMLHHPMGSEAGSLVEIDAHTGERRDRVVFTEPPMYEANQFLYSLPLWHVLPDTDEAVLFSQRDGWGHLYLYDLASSKCRHQITRGNLVVRDILRVDAERRQVTFIAGCGEGGHSPYWRKLYRASLDGDWQTLLTPEAADHELVAPEPQFFHLVFGQGKPLVTSISPSGQFFVDHMSTVAEPPVILLRDADASGRIVLELEQTDVSRLEAAGYVAPNAFCVKADDGVTDLWGVISLPADPLDASSIPVVDHMYAGFQTTWTPPSYVGGGKITGAHASLPMYNELGFAAVIIDGRGTPGRHRDFRQWTHHQTKTGRGLHDHVTAITALQALHPSLDLNRVGVIGHSYGGYNAARSMLLFPEFFKVGVSSAGVHDPRKMPYGMWAWFLGEHHARDTEEYRALGNVQLADRLVGHLLIACGEIDENATVDHSYALVDALMKAGKRFDMKVWPGLNHYQQGPYVQMAFWDHFVQHLLGQPVPITFTPATG